MRFRPCIDIHNGKVKQIIGSSLKDEGDNALENFASDKSAAFYARMYREMGLSGGHIILLNPAESPFYQGSKDLALEALRATPMNLQIGGGINADNAGEFLEAGASHVIVTSFVFKNGRINYTNLKKLVKAVGKDKIVLDLSCKKKLLEDGESRYFVVTDRWQKFTQVCLSEETINDLSMYCDEFLVHAADVEGKQNGIEEDVARLLGKYCRIPVTYAGGVHSLEDVSLIKEFGHGNVDVTVGSALDIFGGTLKMEDIIKLCDR